MLMISIRLHLVRDPVENSQATVKVLAKVMLMQSRGSCQLRKNGKKSSSFAIRLRDVKLVAGGAISKPLRAILILCSRLCAGHKDTG